MYDVDVTEHLHYIFFRLCTVWVAFVMVSIHFSLILITVCWYFVQCCLALDTPVCFFLLLYPFLLSHRFLFQCLFCVCPPSPVSSFFCASRALCDSPDIILQFYLWSFPYALSSIRDSNWNQWPDAMRCLTVHCFLFPCHLFLSTRCCEQGVIRKGCPQREGRGRGSSKCG